MCYKNWNGPSTGMEADIIVEGFKQSYTMHGVIYSELIGKTLMWANSWVSIWNLNVHLIKNKKRTVICNIQR